MKDYKKTVEDKFPNLEIIEVFKKDTWLIKFKCKKHGEQIRRYYDFKKSKYGCSECGLENKKYYVKEKEEFIQKAKEVHNNKYDYSLVDYKNRQTKVKIICPTHGVFEQTPASHIGHKSECPICALEERRKNKSINRWKNIKKELDFNNYEYIDFDNTFEPTNIKKKIEIRCKKCGYAFSQNLYYHLHGNGCPECGKKSYGERVINSFLENKGLKLNETFFREKKFKDLRSGKGGNDYLRFDFYIPEKNTVIEYNGRQHYEEEKTFYKTHEEFEEAKRRDQLKKDYCKSKGIFELEIPHWESKNLSNILEEWFINS